MQRTAFIQKRFPLFLISLCFVVNNVLFSQGGTEDVVEVWHHQYFATAEYSYSLSCQCDIAVDDQGNVYVAGHMRDASFRNSIVVLKYGSSGDEIWSAQYDITDCNNRSYDIAVDASGNVYVVGSSSQTGSGTDGLLLKYDNNGSLLWSVVYDGPDGKSDIFKGVLVDGSHLVVFGESDGSTSGTDYITLKYDTTGSQLWCSRFNGASNHTDWPLKMTLDSKGNIYVTGLSDREEPNYYTWAGDFATVKYDANGNQKMVLLFNGLGPDGFNIPDCASDIHVDSEGNIFVTGNSEALGSSTVKYDSSGTLLWVVQSSPPFGPFQDMTLDPSGNIYVTDYTYMIKINPAGTKEWLLYHGGYMVGNMGQDRILTDVEGNIYLASYKFMKYDTNKNLVWLKNVSPYFAPCAIASDASGQLFLSGYDQDMGGYIRTAKYTQIVSYEQSTPVGENVLVSFGNGLNTIFQSIENEGVTTVVESNLGPLPPSNYEIVPLGKPVYYQITTTSVFNPPVVVQIPYDESNIGDVPEENLKIFHYEGDVPIDITTSVDTINNLVIGETMAFSTFILAASQSVSPQQALADLIFDVISLNLDKGLENSLVVKLENAVKSLENKNYQATVNQLYAFINHVDSQQGKKIAEEDANGLIGAAEIIISNVQNGILKEASPDDFLPVCEQVPCQFELSQNYPNPFNSSTTITYSLEYSSYVVIKIYNILGDEVKTLVNEDKDCGSYSINWDGNDNSGNFVATGLYIYKIHAGDFSQIKKMVYFK